MVQYENLIRSVMKTIKCLVLFSLIITTGAILFGQKPITVSEGIIFFNNAKCPGIVITIPEFNFEAAQKNWIKKLQSGTKSKVVTENKEMTICGAMNKNISPNPFNIYSKFENRDTVLLLMTAFEISKDKYIEKASGENEFTQVKLFLKEFAKEQYAARVEDELSSEQKFQKRLNDHFESLQKEKLKFQKSIQSNKSDSIQAVNNINIQNSEIASLTKEIMDQNNQMVSMQPGKVKDEKADYIKGLEKRKKKAFNEIESLQNKIVKMNSENLQYKDDIVKNESDQEVMKGKVAQQELVVKKCEDKLAMVKAF
jgi:hypothetical protein